jgi:hypothetical protein
MTCLGKLLFQIVSPIFTNDAGTIDQRWWEFCISGTEMSTIQIDKLSRGDVTTTCGVNVMLGVVTEM